MSNSRSEEEPYSCSDLNLNLDITKNEHGLSNEVMEDAFQRVSANLVASVWGANRNKAKKDGASWKRSDNSAFDFHKNVNEEKNAADFSIKTVSSGSKAKGDEESPGSSSSEEVRWFR